MTLRGGLGGTAERRGRRALRLQGNRSNLSSFATSWRNPLLIVHRLPRSGLHYLIPPTSHVVCCQNATCFINVLCIIDGMNECVDVNGSRTYFPVLVTLCLVCLNAFECVCLHVPVYGVFVFIAVCKVLRIYGQSGRTSEAHMVREYLCQHLKQRLYNFLPFLKKKNVF